ncbi:MAG: NAD(P)H-dependent oxidoreductase subunit E [Oscillospiraceae bacterium]|nr:NAD(P)H-dependent oxidoreductase subunit E [Oscillospiraceae bacterium]
MADSTIAFKGTKEQEAKLMEAIELHRSQPGPLMPVLQAAQDIYGYMPREVLEIISRQMQMSLSDIYGIVTFYSQFHLEPKGKHKIHICLGTACYVKGAGKILERFEKELGIKDGECTPDGNFSIDALRCVGACGLAPVMSVNDDVYGKVTEDQVPEILAKYKA